MTGDSQTPTRHVFLVEDDPDHAELMSFFMGEVMPDLAIERLEDGEQAMVRVDEVGAAAEGPMPWLILLDINLPKHDGHEVLARIRSYERLRSVPVVICSTSEARADVRRALQLGANSYVTKPLSYDGFESLVHTTLQFWSLSRHEVAFPQVQGA